MRRRNEVNFVPVGGRLGINMYLVKSGRRIRLRKRLLHWKGSLHYKNVRGRHCLYYKRKNIHGKKASKEEIKSIRRKFRRFQGLTFFWIPSVFHIGTKEAVANRKRKNIESEVAAK